MSLWETEVEKSKIPDRARPGTNLFDSLFKPRQAPNRQAPKIRNESVARLLADNARLKRLVEMSETDQASNQANVDQIAKLLIQRAQLEEEMAKREKRYKELLKEAQDLIKQMRLERDAETRETRSREADREARSRERARSREDERETRSRRDRYRDRSRETGHRDIRSEIRSREYRPPEEEPEYHIAQEIEPRDQRRYSYRTQDELSRMFTPHDDHYFQCAFNALDAAIKKLTHAIIKKQKDRLQLASLHPVLETYLSKHNITPLQLFGLRDVRVLVSRGFIMDFLLERIFRPFLFGLDTQTDAAYRDAYTAMNVNTRSQWASHIARSIISTNSDYRPRKAADTVVSELSTYLRPILGTVSTKTVVLQCIELARDCRVSESQFSISLPSYNAEFYEMEASHQEYGDVAIAYAPKVSVKRMGYEDVLVKAKVWRQSVLHDFMDLAPP